MSTPMTTLSLFDRPEAARETRPARSSGGLTLPVLAFAALVASPAIWQCLVRHTVPMHVMLERYVVIALGCLLVSEGARRLMGSPTAADPADPTDAEEPAGDLETAGMTTAEG